MASLPAAIIPPYESTKPTLISFWSRIRVFSSTAFSAVERSFSSLWRCVRYFLRVLMPAQLRIMLGDELPVDGGIAPAADCYGAFDLTDIVALLVGTLELLFLVVIVRVDDCHGSGLGTLVDRARLILLVELLLKHASEHYIRGTIG